MPRVNRTRFAVLGMLSLGEHSGYDLKVNFERRMSEFWAESVGQIYPTLRRLLREGAVTSRAEDNSGRRRRLYSLTDQGRKELREWLAEPPQREHVRNEILLKFFFGPEMGIDTALEHLDRFQAAKQAQLDRLESFPSEILEAADTEEQALFWQVTLSSGLHAVRARLAWCRETRERLEAHREAAAGRREAS